MTPSVLVKPGRFARFEAVEWWNKERVLNGRVLVVGAGALGNEILKNLALLGIGFIEIIDRDCIERSNLCRSVLFREVDEGQPKADCAARAMRELCPSITVTPLNGDVSADVGLGHFRWADVVVGALDNREARVFVNAACARLGKPWLDGGLDMLQGIARGFSPPRTACYECTMSEVDWQLLNQQRSCSLLARRAALNGGTPTSPTTASVIGGILAQEVLKILHGMDDALLGKGYVFEGKSHNSYSVTYPVKPGCGWHEEVGPVFTVAGSGPDTPLDVMRIRAEAELGGLDAFDLSREIVRRLECSACGQATDLWKPAAAVTAEQARCRKCRGECVPSFIHSLTPDGAFMGRTARELGLPGRDIVWARFKDKGLGLEFER